MASSKLNLYGRLFRNLWMMEDHHLGLFEAYHMPVIRWPAEDTSPLFCFRSKRVDSGLFFVHKDYLVAVDMPSHVGTIPTWLASYFLV